MQYLSSECSHLVATSLYLLVHNVWLCQSMKLCKVQKQKCTFNSVISLIHPRSTFKTPFSFDHMGALCFILLSLGKIQSGCELLIIFTMSIMDGTLILGEERNKLLTKSSRTVVTVGLKSRFKCILTKRKITNSSFNILCVICSFECQMCFVQPSIHL